MLIDTVEKSQGCEIDLVLYSTVRTNGRYALGFVKDYRRLNVSITRAKKGMLIFGDVSTLFYGDIDDCWRLFFGILTRTVFYWMRLCTLSNWKVCYLIRGSSSTSSSNGNCSHTCRSLVVVVVNERIRDVFIFVIGLRLLLERMLSALRIHQLQLLLNPNPSKVRQRDADWIYLNKTYKGILRLL